MMYKKCYCINNYAVDSTVLFEIYFTIFLTHIFSNFLNVLLIQNLNLLFANYNEHYFEFTSFHFAV